MPVVQQPEAYIANSASLLYENGNLNNEETIQFLQSVVNAFIELIRKHQE